MVGRQEPGIHGSRFAVARFEGRHEFFGNGRGRGRAAQLRGMQAGFLDRHRLEIDPFARGHVIRPAGLVGPRIQRDPFDGPGPRHVQAHQPGRKQRQCEHGEFSDPRGHVPSFVASGSSEMIGSCVRDGLEVGFASSSLRAQKALHWILAFAGMTTGRERRGRHSRRISSATLPECGRAAGSGASRSASSRGRRTPTSA